MADAGTLSQHIQHCLWVPQRKTKYEFNLSPSSSLDLYHNVLNKVFLAYLTLSSAMFLGGSVAPFY